jgi:TonB family protein
MRRFRKSAKTSMPAPIFQAQPVLTNPAKQSITGPVSVDVRVDVAESGVVDKAEVVQFSDPLNVDVTNSALAAAVRWTFEPARSDDLAVSSKVILHFRFTP